MLKSTDKVTSGVIGGRIDEGRYTNGEIEKL